MNCQLIVFDVAICKKPLKMGQRTLLCDEMWLPLDESDMHILEPIKNKLTHTIYTIDGQDYNTLIDGSYLKILSDDVYEFLSEKELFVKFYAGYKQHLDDWKLSISDDLDIDVSELELLGWEVVDNGGNSASYEGVYPLNSYSDFFYLKNELEDVFPINEWGLFCHLDYAIKYCDINNSRNKDGVPWVPIAILCKKQDKNRLRE